MAHSEAAIERWDRGFLKTDGFETFEFNKAWTLKSTEMLHLFKWLLVIL